MKGFSKSASQNLINILRKNQAYDKLVKGSTKVLDNPNLFMEAFESRLYVPKMKLRELEFLAFLSWHMDKNLGWMIRNEIEIKLSKFSYKDVIVTKLLCDTSEIAENFYRESILFHPRKVFGNDLQRALRILKLIKFQEKSHAPVSEERRIGVGYKDKGSLPKTDHRTELDLEQIIKNEALEKDKLRIQNTTDFLRGLLGG